MLGKLQFGVYELDRDAMELRKHGLPLKLQEQPFRILAALVERPGQIVTREELRELIWGKDTFVDFEQSLNKAVNRVREALNDDAGHPQYVETGSHFYGETATSISPDGSKVAFASECREGKWPTGYTPFCTFILPAGGGKPEQVCELCSPAGFSSNGSLLLIDRYSKLGDVKDRIAAVELTTNTEKDFLSAPDKGLYHASFSWDDRWVVFIIVKSWEPYQSQIMIAPVGRGAAGNAAEWIAVTDGRHSDDKPQFSPDGNTVYYTSTRDGYLCIWAQKLDPTTKHPVGVPAPFEHFHNAAGRDAAAYFKHWCDLTVASDKMLINLPRVSKDIWVVQVE